MNTKIWALAIGVGFLAWSAHPALAADYTCTPEAIHQKFAFTKQLWNKLENDKVSGDQLTAGLDKIWDGSGDCSGDEDMSKFSFTTLSELVRTHYLGDMMSSTFDDGIKQYAVARQRLDDFWQAEDFVKENAAQMPSEFMAEDTEIVKQMHKLDSKLTQLGYTTKYKKKS
ncbi:MAG: hypothetical protein NVSMB31_04680 [Vulcanimicrobiaceae bacterium]